MKTALRLPPLPDIVRRLIDTIGDDEVELPEVARLIGADPALTLELLKLVNSPFYGLPRPVGSVQDALQVLGLATVRRLVMSTALVRPFARVFASQADAHDFWMHHFACAAFTEALCGQEVECAALGYTAGMLHDVGRLTFLLEDSAAFALWQAGRREPEADPIALERRLFGRDHAEAGAELLAHWRMPEVIVRAVAYHHALEAPASGCCARALARADGLLRRMALRPAQGDAPAAPPSMAGEAELIARVSEQIALFQQLLH